MKVRVANLGPGHYGYIYHRRWKDRDIIELKERTTVRVNVKTGKREKVTLSPEMQFSDKWMEKVGKSTKQTVVEPAAEEESASSEPTGDQKVI
jgi:hypothetical protein